MLSFVERFTKYIKIVGDCWEWQAHRDKDGYGIFTFKHHHSVKAHRFSYELYKGAIPTDLVIDHLCRNRKCVNPNHLEIVTNKENCLRGIGPSAINSRKTHCNRGHPFDEENTYYQKNGRLCKMCNNENARKRKEQNPEGFRLRQKLYMRERRAKSKPCIR